MKYIFSTLVAMASAISSSIDYHKDPYYELDIIVDGQAHSVYIADTYWTKIKDYDVPPPQPGDYEYGGECTTLHDDDCNGCWASGSCNWSWPKFSTHSDPWDNDPDRKCRCLPADIEPSDLGSEFTMGFNGRAYFSNTQMFDKSQFFTPNLLGGSMEYDVDLSQASCNCNAAFYMIAMPAKNADGSFRAGESDGMYYCDANEIGGAFCPEFDIMEANIHAYRAVNHHCSDPVNGHYSWCDRAGSCAVDIITDFPDTDPYGPGSSYTINT